MLSSDEGGSPTGGGTEPFEAVDAGNGAHSVSAEAETTRAAAVIPPPTALPAFASVQSARGTGIAAPPPLPGTVPTVGRPQHAAGVAMPPPMLPPTVPQAVYNATTTQPASTSIGISIPPVGATESGGAPLEHFEQMVADEQGAGAPQVWGWLQKNVAQSQLVARIAEKAKTGVDAMITTLDPQMKDYMDASGSIDIAVASDKLAKINGVKEGFQRVFARVTVRGLGAPGVDADHNWAPQPVGFEHGIKGAQRRAAALRQSGLAPVEAIVVAVENFLFEAMPNVWYDAGYLLLDDARRGITVATLTQPTLVPDSAVQLLKHHTPSDYPLRASGMAVSVGAAVAEASHGAVEPADWHRVKCGVDRHALIDCAARALAHMYRDKLIELGHWQVDT